MTLWSIIVHQAPTTGKIRYLCQKKTERQAHHNSNVKKIGNFSLYSFRLRQPVNSCIVQQFYKDGNSLLSFHGSLYCAKNLLSL